MTYCTRLAFLLFAPVFLASNPAAAATLSLSSYSIYLASDAPPSVAFAAQELQRHVEQATGHALPIMDTPVPPMISLGENKASRKAGVTAEALPWEASRIVTHEGNVYIVGRDVPDDGKTPLGGRSYGTLYGTYTFLERIVGVRWLMPGEHGTVVPHRPDLVVGELDIVDQPGFEYRQLSGICNVMTDWYLHQRFDQNVPFGDARPIHSPFPKTGRSGTGGSLEFNGNHAWDVLFPPPGDPRAAYLADKEATYRKHPDFFEMSKDGTRVKPIANFSLCLSHPDIDAEVARRVGILAEKEDLCNVSIFPNDATPRCACEQCQSRLIEPDPRYHVGDRSESVWSKVTFEYFRDVAERVAETHPGKTVSGGCYYKHEVPYEGLARMPENFMANMAPVRIAYGPLRLAPKHNTKWHALLEAWRPAVPNMLYYGVDFWLRDYSGAPNVPCIALMRDTFTTLRKLNYRGAYFYGNLGYGKSSLVNYILAKLLWDPARDPEEVFDEFCEAAYGTGSRHIKAMYTILDGHMAEFVRTHIDDPIGYNMYPELLRDVYGSEWNTMETLFLEARTEAESDAVRWRLARLGDNLKLLYYHLTRLDLAPADTNSPLYMTEEESRELNTQRLAPWPVTPGFATPHLRDALVELAMVTNAPPLPEAPPMGAFRLQYHQDVLIVPDRDGTVTARIHPETSINPQTGAPWLPDIPYYTLYDLTNKQSIFTGIAAEGGRTIRFDGERGKRYLLMISGLGRYYSGTRYGFDANAPWALGEKVDPKGLRFHSIETPVYFWVPASAGDFELVFTGSADAEIVNPSGAVAATVDCTDYEVAALSAEDQEDGFWTIRFKRPSQVCIRQDRKLSGFFVLDPTQPLVVEKK